LYQEYKTAGVAGSDSCSFLNDVDRRYCLFFVTAGKSERARGLQRTAKNNPWLKF
jgi:hypothetical protein